MLTMRLKLLVVVCLVISFGAVSLAGFLFSSPSWNNLLIYNVSPTRMKPTRHEKANSNLQQDQKDQEESKIIKMKKELKRKGT